MFVWGRSSIAMLYTLLQVNSTMRSWLAGFNPTWTMSMLLPVWYVKVVSAQYAFSNLNNLRQTPAWVLLGLISRRRLLPAYLDTLDSVPRQLLTRSTHWSSMTLISILARYEDDWPSLSHYQNISLGQQNREQPPLPPRNPRCNHEGPSFHRCQLSRCSPPLALHKFTPRYTRFGAWNTCLAPFVGCNCGALYKTIYLMRLMKPSDICCHCRISFGWD